MVVSAQAECSSEEQSLCASFRDHGDSKCSDGHHLSSPDSALDVGRWTYSTECIRGTVVILLLRAEKQREQAGPAGVAGREQTQDLNP